MKVRLSVEPSTGWTFGGRVATRSPHDALDLLFAVGAQIISIAVPVKTRETSPEVASQPSFRLVELFVRT